MFITMNKNKNKNQNFKRKWLLCDSKRVFCICAGFAFLQNFINFK